VGGERSPLRHPCSLSPPPKIPEVGGGGRDGAVEKSSHFLPSLLSTSRTLPNPFCPGFSQPLPPLPRLWLRVRRAVILNVIENMFERRSLKGDHVKYPEENL